MRYVDLCCDRPAPTAISLFPAAEPTIRLSWLCWQMNCGRLVCRFVLPTNSDCRRRQKKQQHSHCWLFRHGIVSRRMCHRLPERKDQGFWERFHMREKKSFRRSANAQPWAAVPTWLFVVLALIVPLLSCSSKPDPNPLVMVIENS